ncbi:hypothetical protein IAR55_001537 [Kwoniella newhampshirensis]|uniref:CNH domain-containing protein n=1 Tax=Kwoniella newhampshirensis TaxID=1651941 RepID=A0AAW0Z2G0_9TREE
MISELPHFQIQPVLSDLYHTKDLLDFSGPSSPPLNNAQLVQASPSLFSSASSIAAAAGRRAAAVASAAASPSSQHSARVNTSLSPDRSGGAEVIQGKEVRCVEGYGPNMYVGGSDGVIEWWVCDGQASAGQNNGWILRNQHTLFPRRPVSKMYILPKIAKILIISDGTLHALALPNLEPISSSLVPPLRGVVSMALDDDELEWSGPGTEDKTAEMTVVIVRRKGLGVYRLGNRMNSVKELPLPSAPTHLALFQTYLCAAIHSPETDNTLYSIIDLSDASLTEVLPVTQIDPSVAEFVPNPNVVVIPGESEFLVTSFTGSTTMGVFLNGQGDPVRGTMEWDAHPLSIAVESGYIIALLRNNTVVIHSLADLDKPAQTIALETSFPAIALSYSPYGVSVRDLLRDERMAMTSITLLGGKLAPSETIGTKILASDPGASEGVDENQESSSPVTSPVGEEPPSGSGLTPPSSPHRKPIVTPQRGSSLGAPLPGPFSTAIAETLVIGPDGIQSLLPTQNILRLEALCAERHMEEAIALVDDERRRGRRGEVDVDKATHQATLRLMHLYLASHLFHEAMFDKAGDYFIRGKADPRLLVRCYRNHRGKVIGSAEEVDVYEGLKEILTTMPDVEEIVLTSIKRNYSPHVQPNSATAPETTVLRAALEDEARNMLTECLRKTRTSRRKGGGARGIDSRKIDIVVDTTLAKLLADKGTTNELLALLAQPNDCILTELEPFLTQRPYVLATVMRQQGRMDRVLELLREIAESPVPDPLCEDPVYELAQQLDSVKDPETFTKYILWLIGKSPSKGLEILMTQNPKTGIKLDDADLISSIRQVNEEAANRYLEHVVVLKRSPKKELHRELLDCLLNEAGSLAEDDGVKYHLEELETEYKLESEPRPFIVFLAYVAPDTPIKRVRLKLLLFLQGSPFYDLEAAAKRLEGMPLLKPELAVVYGRLGKHRQALHLLAREIGDSLSAQAYCTQGGEIIPPRVARIVGERVTGLQGWTTLGEVGRRRKDVDEETMRGLVKELLGVYMRDGKEYSRQAAWLLNAQSVHLDVLEVLDQMPDEWSVDVVSTFMKRSLRRGLHDRASWSVLKAIAAGQNLEVSEQHLDKIAQIPPIIKFAPAQSLPSPDEGSIPEKEWQSYDEKGGMLGLTSEQGDGEGRGEKVKVDGEDLDGGSSKEVGSLGLGEDERRNVL